jgi:sulfide:quinone oxidoreductase
VELQTTLSAALGEGAGVTVIDKSDAFVFGYSKLNVTFGRTTLDAIRLPYSTMAKSGVRALQDAITASDPDTRRGEDRPGRARRGLSRYRARGRHDIDATPGLSEGRE